MLLQSFLVIYSVLRYRLSFARIFISPRTAPTRSQPLIFPDPTAPSARPYNPLGQTPNQTFLNLSPRYVPRTLCSFGRAHPIHINNNPQGL